MGIISILIPQNLNLNLNAKINQSIIKKQKLLHKLNTLHSILQLKKEDLQQKQKSKSAPLNKKQMNLKIQNLKEAAYFDYFKSFSLNAFDTIKKLQTEFKDEIQESFFFNSNMMFKRVKTLIGSYEILIFEINDSCEFVQIPEFGNCILKIFLQIMSIIRFLLHKILEKSDKKQQTNGHNLGEKFSKSKASFNMTQTNLSGSPNNVNEHQRIIYKNKQQSKYMMNNLKQQLSLLELEQTQDLQTSKKQFKSLIESKQKLQSIEISQNENILSEALNSFCKKGEHLKNFVNIRQAAMANNMKEGMGQYLKLKDILDDDSNQKLANASVKLQQLFKSHTLNYLKYKQHQMVSQQVQVKIEEPLDNKILEENKHIKKLNDLIKRLNDEVCFEKQKCSSLQDLLKTKTQQFQLKTMKYRVAKVQMQNFKAKKQKMIQSELSLINNGSKRSLCVNCHNRITVTSSVKRSQGQCISKSLIQDQEYNQLHNHSEPSDTRTDEIAQNPSRLMQKMTRRVHYQNNKKQIVFKHLDTKSGQLQLFRNVWSIQIQPDLVEPLEKQMKKKTIAGRATSGNVGLTNNTFSFRDHKRNKTKLLASQLKNTCLTFQKVLSFNYEPSYQRMSSQNKKQMERSPRLLGVIGYTRKQTESGREENQTVIKQIIQKWLDNDISRQSYEKHQQIQNYPNLKRNQTELNKNSRENQTNKENQNLYRNIESDSNLIAYERNQSKQKFRIAKKQNRNSHQREEQQHQNILNFKEHPNSLNSNSPTAVRKTFQKTKQASHQFMVCPNEASKLSNPALNRRKQKQIESNLFTRSLSQQNNDIPLTTKEATKIKYPKFRKFSETHQKINLNMKQLVNLFFDQNTAKNFQYVNLFQNNEMRIGSVNGNRNKNPLLSANVQQMQKKNFMNNLFNKVKNKTTSAGKHSSFLTGNYSRMNDNQQYLIIEHQSSIEKRSQSPLSGQNMHKIIITDCKSINSTFNGTMMKTNFWNNLAQKDQSKKGPSQQNLQSKQTSELQNLLNFYDFQRLLAILYKQLQDLKRSSTNSTKGSNQLNNHSMLRNFLRYPYSTVSLSNDKKFLDKQTQDSELDYLELRKILKRVFKLHINCAEIGSMNKNSTFQKIHALNSYCVQAQSNNYKGKQNEKRICQHLINFYQKVGVTLFPTIHIPASAQNQFT